MINSFFKNKNSLEKQSKKNYFARRKLKKKFFDYFFKLKY